jgi:hypothetical protein
MSASSHNEVVNRLMREMAKAADGQTSKLNVICESLLVGVGLMNFPTNPRAQAAIIQEIADAAQDRAKAIRS